MNDFQQSNRAPDCPNCGAQGMAWTTHACIPKSAITPLPPQMPLDCSHWLWKDGFQAGYAAGVRYMHDLADGVPVSQDSGSRESDDA